MTSDFEYLIDRPIRSTVDREERCLELIRAYAANTITEAEHQELIRLMDELDGMTSADVQDLERGQKMR
jgi:hypothetical protein